MLVRVFKVDNIGVLNSITRKTDIGSLCNPPACLASCSHINTTYKYRYQMCPLYSKGVIHILLLLLLLLRLRLRQG